jgi:hypothetical protein
MRSFFATLLLSAAIGTQAATSVVVKNLKSADGTAIYAEATGTYGKPHVIFAHGLACTAVSWDALWNDAQMQNQLYMVGSATLVFLMWWLTATLGSLRYSWPWSQREAT